MDIKKERHIEVKKKQKNKKKYKERLQEKGMKVVIEYRVQASLKTTDYKANSAHKQKYNSNGYTRTYYDT